MSVLVAVVSYEPGGDTKIAIPSGFSIETEQAEGGAIVLNVHDEEGGVVAIFRDWRYAIADYVTPDYVTPDEEDDDEVDGVVTSITARIAERVAA